MDENENINGFADEPMVDDEPEKVSEPAATDESENRYAEPIALSAEELKKAYKEQTERAKVVKRAEKKAKALEKKAMKKEKRASHAGFRKKFWCAILFGVLFGACAAGAFFAIDKFLIPKDNTAVEKVAELEKKITELEASVEKAGTGVVVATVETDITKVAEDVMPSMVSVTNLGVATTSDWFGRTYSYDTESAGSGIIIGENDNEYFIASNYHVIADSKTLTVMFADSTTAEAYVKGYDESLDIAVIAVQKSTLEEGTDLAIKVAKLGNSDLLKIGEPAIAIGNALGYGQSVTTGVVSAVSRDIEIEGTTYESLIQTNAAINPGNSGGALLNINGEVIGINSAKLASSTIEGMGFAIPISKVKDILISFADRETREKLSDESKGYLGITGSREDLTVMGYPAGALVADVTEGGPADNAGIFKYDIITKVDGLSVHDLASLQELLSYYAPGETISVTVLRIEAGEFAEKTVDVTLGKKPEN